MPKKVHDAITKELAKEGRTIQGWVVVVAVAYVAKKKGKK